VILYTVNKALKLNEAYMNVRTVIHLLKYRRRTKGTHVEKYRPSSSMDKDIHRIHGQSEFEVL
jgi:hypothetical protein